MSELSTPVAATASWAPSPIELAVSVDRARAFVAAVPSQRVPVPTAHGALLVNLVPGGAMGHVMCPGRCR